MLRSYLYGVPLPKEIPGTSSKTSLDLKRPGAMTELRFG